VVSKPQSAIGIDACGDGLCGAPDQGRCRGDVGANQASDRATSLVRGGLLAQGERPLHGAGCEVGYLAHGLGVPGLHEMLNCGDVLIGDCAQVLNRPQRRLDEFGVCAGDPEDFQ